MKIAVSAYDISPPGTLGGNTRILLEYLKVWGCSEDITIFTTPSGFETFKRYGLHDKFQFKVLALPEFFWKKFYARQIFLPLFLMPVIFETGKTKFDLVYTATDFISDVFFGWLLKIRSASSLRWLSSITLFILPPWSKNRDYGDIRYFPRIKYLCYWLYQKIIIFLSTASDMMFVTNELDKNLVTRPQKENILAVYGGIDFATASKTKKTTMKYDCVFVGRLHPQKGVPLLIHAWKSIHSLRPESRLAIIGNGEEKYVDELKDLARKERVCGSIDWLGFLDGTDKYSVFSKSRIFLHTSVYDNFGMAAAEAMGAGLPTVLFDIPAQRYSYPKGVLRARFLDTSDFAVKVQHLLESEEHYVVLSKEAQEYAKSLDWNVRAARALEFIRARL